MTYYDFRDSLCQQRDWRQSLPIHTFIRSSVGKSSKSSCISVLRQRERTLHNPFIGRGGLYQYGLRGCVWRETPAPITAAEAPGAGPNLHRSRPNRPMSPEARRADSTAGTRTPCANRRQTTRSPPARGSRTMGRWRRHRLRGSRRAANDRCWDTESTPDPPRDGTRAAGHRLRCASERARGRDRGGRWRR